MTPHDDDRLNNPCPDDAGPPPADELDTLLRTWHRQHADRAEALRDQFMQRLAGEKAAQNREPLTLDGVQKGVSTEEAAAAGPSHRNLIRRLVVNRYSPIAASLILAAVLIPQFWPSAVTPSFAKEVVMAPEGGRLDALDATGNVMGPCPLKHTDVSVDISGLFTRVTVRQQYHNPYDDKIEAVYTFPLSHRSAVDRMTMTIGERVIVGEVHERAKARAIYEAAREQGYVASLLEQERPNIFTQSVANIEPKAEVLIEISYVELLEPKDGAYSFSFPMVVGPRYIPGAPKTAPPPLPVPLKQRHGIIQLSPAELTVGQAGDTARLGQLQPAALQAMIRSAVPILPPENEWWKQNADRQKDGAETGPTLWYRFEASYPNGSKEHGTLHTDCTGQLNGRWFYFSRSAATDAGNGFSPDTNQVPDASRITPMPVKPDRRAGHDISLRVTLDTGGPGIKDVQSLLHQTVRTQAVSGDDGLPYKMGLELMKADEIPNRDFVLNWRQTADTIQEATFTHTGRQGNFFTLILQPPARVDTAQAVARELIFVLDSSGSMSGFPIEKAKEVTSKAIDGLRPQDTFNLITFAGDTRILWDQPRPFTEANRREAQAFLSSRRGSGGTEMMKAINAALVQAPEGQSERHWLTPDELADLPADGRTVIVHTRECDLVAVFQNGMAPTTVDLKLTGGLTLRAMIRNWMLHTGPGYFDPNGSRTVEMEGRWVTKDRQRLFEVEKADARQATMPDTAVPPMRIVCFMTDGYVGNDMVIIDAVKNNARTTRVFSFGIGNSVNRYLLDSMARAGRGEVEYVLLSEGADEKVARFLKRIQTPVLTDIQLTFGDDLKVDDVIPGQIPDLFDCQPLVVHGRYTQPGTGTLTIRGRTGAGPYERTLNLELPAAQPAHDTIATLWARAKVEEIMTRDMAALQEGRFPETLKQEIVALGERFQIMTQFTSFVAVEKARVTIGGQPRLVAVPIEMPQGVSYEGIFGPGCRLGLLDKATPEDLQKDCLTGLQAAVTQLADADGRKGDQSSFTQADDQFGITRTARTSEVAEAMKRHIRTYKLQGVQGESVRFLDTGAASPQAVRGLGEAAGALASGDYGLYSTGMAGGSAGAGHYMVQAAPPPPHQAGQPQPPTSALDRFRVFGGLGGDVSSSPSDSVNNLQIIDSTTTQPAASADDHAASLLARLNSDKGRQVAANMLLRERIALLIVALVQDKKIDEARKLAQALTAFDPGYTVGTGIRDILVDTKLSADDRSRRIEELARPARAAVDKALQQARLRRVLDPGLQKIAENPETKPADAQLIYKDGRVLVTVSLAGPESRGLVELERAGLQIESFVSSVPLVVGWALPDRLVAIALVDGIRRIEPTECVATDMR